MKNVIAVVGCPGSGKSWVCNQLKDKYHHLPHDNFIGLDYVKAILDAESPKELLIEMPFSISKIKEPLEKAGVKVITIFIIEPHKVLEERYAARDGKVIPKGHLTRQATYEQRANESKSFKGTSAEVLEHLKGL